MKRIAVWSCVLLGLALAAGQSRAGWCSEICYSGYQPWWNIFAKRYKCITPEEERLQKFWHDYYDAMRNYYGALDHIDWVAYYKNHGYQINGGCGMGGGCCGRVNYAPVVVAPNLIWAVPQGCMNGPPCAPGYPGGYPGGACPGGACPGGYGGMPGPGPGGY